MNGILIVDKPSGWTSQDVCSKIRGVTHVRRVGHSGTLDPMATGVLTVFIGRATRAVEFTEGNSKRYTARMRLGITTDTQDTTGATLSRRPVEVTGDEIEEVLREFTGDISQVPPMYSAIKVGGRKLYELARRGESVERAPRPVTIYALHLLGRDGEDYVLDVRCSKGTYVRTLVADIGERLGCGAAMSGLRRTAAGIFTLADAHTIEEICALAEAGGLEGALLPTESLFRGLPRVNISGQAERRARNGNVFRAPVGISGRCLVYSESGEFLLLGEAAGGEIKTIKSFFDPV